MLAQRGYFYDITTDNYSFSPGTPYDSHHLGECVERRYVRKSRKGDVKQRHSQLSTANNEQSNLLQMTDLLAGAVAFSWNKGRDRTSIRSVGMKALADSVQKSYGGIELDKASRHSGPFVIWKFSDSKEEDGPSSTAPGNVLQYP